MKLSELHPVFYHARIKQFQLTRSLRDLISRNKFARDLVHKDLPYSCKKHQSLLRRKLGQSDPMLQENKIINLQLAVKQLNGVCIRPGETFSFWKLVGKTTAKRGYIKGLLLSQGKVITGVGGGICQLANLLYWMGLHTPLQIVERHHHHFDPFPDDHRVLPFGSGASVFYNYIDLRMHNPTDQTFQFRVWLTDEHLRGVVFSDQQLCYSYHIKEKKHRFSRVGEKTYRENEIWRDVIDKRTGNTIKEEMLIANFSEVKYEVEVV
ncbi:VanW family protein [Paenibacillus sp. N1-5-1-14]|uniref:VanW family protein n=1 Tax=Paenibacillus radicibacter TaxID=2972488 RepID=UPI002159928B|nr:VanW family protein [Paenibacillus radicibacter]MCR8642670.1 VanW family protein [Paenibacillus radicibacter]